MQDLWLLKHDASDAAMRMLASIRCNALDLQTWHALDDSVRYSFTRAADAPLLAADGSGLHWPWQRLRCLQEIDGASVGETAANHYIVETDVLPEFEDDLNAWYAQEHLPGLAGVPGTVRAARYRDDIGSPKSYACYDLTNASVLGSPPWLAVRETPWSARVRPAFRNTRRTMFGKLPTS